MMKILFKNILLGLLALILHANVFAGERNTADDAIALVKKVSAYLKANDKEKTFAEINNPNSQFKAGELYVAIIDINGRTLAHGANPRLVGKEVLEMRDAYGKYFIKNFIDVAKGKGSGWVDYKWPNPITQAVESKSTYVEKVDDLVISCGIYK